MCVLQGVSFRTVRTLVEVYLLSKENCRTIAKRESASTKGATCLSKSLSSSNQR